MSATQQPSWKTGCFAIALALAGSPGIAADPVRTSFDLMLAHPPVPAGAAPAVNGPADPLIAALVVPLRDGNRRASPAAPADPVAESYARMLGHQPGRFNPALPEGTGVDPLVQAVVWPLLRANQYTVAGTEPPARH